MSEDTYIDVLNGTGFVPNWPGTHSHGSRIIRDSVTREIVDVLPPLAVQITGIDTSGNSVSETIDVPTGNETVLSTNSYASLTAPAEEEPAQDASQDAPQEAPADNPIQVHVAVVNTSDAPPEPVQPQADTLQDAMQRLGQ